jgi:hypothetical protein
MVVAFATRGTLHVRLSPQSSVRGKNGPTAAKMAMTNIVSKIFVNFISISLKLKTPFNVSLAARSAPALAMRFSPVSQYSSFSGSTFLQQGSVAQSSAPSGHSWSLEENAPNALQAA